ncbi:hypothetical protein V2G00_000487 [Escherichia coli]|nr:hypothetical protein [Escherichia coli]
MKPSYEELEQKLAESQREFRAADATIENLQMQVEKLAAENAGLKKFCKDAAFDADYESELLGERGGFVDGLSLVKTQATDAFLAEVRASVIADAKGLFKNSSVMVYSESVVEELSQFAAQLRQEAAK